MLDFSTMVSGPFCGQSLGDLGADVIKIETPRGEFSRLMGPMRGGLSGFFAQFNRNKRSLVLDLKQEAAQQLARRLAATADVVVENFRPGVAERLGIGYDALAAVNERLVYVSVSGFGPDGPYRDHPAYDPVIQGMTALMPVQGGKGNPPQLLRSLMADKTTAMQAASATLAALLARERTGRGQRVDVPMLDAYAAISLPDLMIPEAFQPADPASINVPEVDIYRVFRTADDYVVGILLEDRQWHAFCRGVNRPDLIDHPDYRTILDRFQHGEACFALVEDEIAKWPTMEFLERMRTEGAPFGPVHDLARFQEDVQVRHNQTTFDVDDPQGGPARYLRYPARFAGTPASLHRHPPRLGEHTDELLAEIGLSPEEIQDLRDRTIVA
ncbi:MAG: CoA transferase [Proteobacteria bacterium]|nr:CoA transferase [Pseudomonadota bacterium]